MPRLPLLAGLAVMALGLSISAAAASSAPAVPPADANAIPASRPLDLAAPSAHGDKYGRDGGGCGSSPAGAPELDPNWTTAGLVLLIGGAILVAGSRRRERLYA